MDKDKLLTQPIILYISHLVASKGSEPELLPGELVLCEKFKVARGTVRRAMECLIQRGVVIKLPKRRGYFSNPHFSHFGELNIGVIVSGGASSCMSYASADVFSGFVEGIKPLYCQYSFITIPDNDPRVVASCAGNDSGMDALCWISPGDESIEAIQYLIDSGFPVTVIENPYFFHRIHPRSNYLRYDRTFAGELRAKQILKAGFRKPLYCALPSETTDSFGNYLQSQQIPFDAHSILGLEEIPLQVPTLLENGKADCIVCDGDNRRYCALFETVNKLSPERKKIRIFLEREVNSQIALQKYKEINSCYFEGLDIRKTSYNAGKRAGILLRDLLSKKKTHVFETELYQ